MARCKFHVWKVDPNAWSVDAQGRATGPCFIKMISKHRVLHRAVLSAAGQYGRCAIIAGSGMDEKILHGRTLEELIAEAHYPWARADMDKYQAELGL